MILFLSPAKTLDFETDRFVGDTSIPYFLDESEKVNTKLRKLSRPKLMKLQSISRQLAELNYERNQSWEKSGHEKGRQAVMAFKGDVYQGLNADQWDEQDMAFAKEHLRILSGLYGILRPSDAILPYRLEMGTSLPVGRRKDLYDFWHHKIKAYFKKNIPEDELIINLASNEYFKAVEAAKVKNPVLAVDFKDYTKGSFKIVSFYAKKARGYMADYIIKNQIDNKEALKGFNTEGYYFDAKTSTENKFVFLRD